MICSSVTRKQFEDMSMSSKRNWKCPECYTRQPKRDNTNTPVHTKTTDSQTANVTLRSSRRNPVNSGSMSESEDLDKHSDNGNLADISEIVRKEVSAAMRSELPSLMKKLFESNFNPIKAQLNTLQESVKFISDQYEDIKESIHTIVNENKVLKTECAQLRETVSSLSDRLNSMEQYMRDSNIEIQGVPEFMSENIVNFVKHIAKVVSAKLADDDILSCTRVAAMNKNSQRPRAIVVRLRSSRCRVEVYSAVQRFNKAHQDKKLNSSHLGIAGEITNIYVGEHLSPSNKALHAAARIKSRELGYKFVWVRNGHIFVRKDENSRFILIKNHQTVSSLE